MTSPDKIYLKIQNNNDTSFKFMSPSINNSSISNYIFMIIKKIFWNILPGIDDYNQTLRKNDEISLGINNDEPILKLSYDDDGLYYLKESANTTIISYSDNLFETSDIKISDGKQTYFINIKSDANSGFDKIPDTFNLIFNQKP